MQYELYISSFFTSSGIVVLKFATRIKHSFSEFGFPSKDGKIIKELSALFKLSLQCSYYPSPMRGCCS